MPKNEDSMSIVESAIGVSVPLENGDLVGVVAAASICGVVGVAAAALVSSAATAAAVVSLSDPAVE